MVLNLQHSLTRRERQIMDILIARERATVSEVQALMPGAPSYSAVRATLRIMEDRGYVRHDQDGASYRYSPRVTPERAKRSALRHMLDTFFNGSPEQMMAALLDGSSSPEELDRIADMIERARGQGR